MWIRRTQTVPVDTARPARTLRGLLSLVFLTTLLTPLAYSADPASPSYLVRTQPHYRSPHQAAIIAEIDSLRDASQLRAAIALATPHVTAARAESDSVFLLQLILREGGIRAGVGQVRQAEEILREALLLSETQGDSLSMCHVLRWLSVSVSGQGRGAEASELCTRLLEVARQLDNPGYEGWALVGLAWQALLSGHGAEAIDLYHQAIPALRRDRVIEGLAWAWNGMGVAHGRLGAYDQALVSYRRASTMAERIEVASMRQFVLGTVLNNLSTLEFGFGDPSVAAGHFRRAYELHVEGGNELAAVTPGLNSAICLTEVGLHTEAIEELVDLVRVCRDAGYLDRLGRILNTLALTHRALGQYSEATAICRQAIALKDTLSMRDRAIVHISLARTLSQVDSCESALTILDAGSRLLENAPDAISDLRLRTARGTILHEDGRHQEALSQLLHAEREGRQHGLSQLSLEILVTTASAYAALGHPDSALVLLDQAAADWETDRGAPLDLKWREERGVWSRRIYTDLAGLLLDQDKDLPPSERARRAFDRLQTFKARTLMERVRGPGTTNLDQQPLPQENVTTLAATQTDGLRPGELLLDFYLGADSSLLFAVTRQECRIVRLPSREVLASKVRLYRPMLEAPPTPDDLLDLQLLQEIQATIGQQLFGELDDLLNRHDRIMIAPDGILNYLPLSELLSSAADSGSPSGSVRQIVRIPSASYLVWQRREGEAQTVHTDTRVLAIAAERGEDAASLRGAVDEVRHLARRFRDVEATIVSADSCPENLAEHLAGFDLLHLAAHAEAHAQNPWRSAILLCPGADEAYLHADRIATLPLQARLAVLSSCTSAGGRVLSGEGVLGLCTAFLSAGVPAVVATLWEVEDRSTARFMDLFYTHLASGRCVAEALATARNDLRADPRTRHPYFWAGFVLTGEGDVRVHLTPQRGFGPTQRGGLMLVLLVAAAAILVFTRKQKQSQQR